MFYVTLPVCCGIHIANNYRREPNATLNKITSFVIPLLAAAGLGFVAGRYPGNFFEGFSFTFIPSPILRALSALKAICIQHAQSLVTSLEPCNVIHVNDTVQLAFYIYGSIALYAPLFVGAPVVAACAYLVFGLIHVVPDYSGVQLGNLKIIIAYHCVAIIIYILRLIFEYITNHR